MNDFNDATSSLGAWGSIIEKGAGYYLLIISTILMVVAGILRVVFVSKADSSDSFYLD